MSVVSSEYAKRPDETVIYSGHWDHLGVGAPDAGPTAVDDEDLADMLAELRRRMVDDAVAGQRPVLHQALHGKSPASRSSRRSRTWSSCPIR